MKNLYQEKGLHDVKAIPLPAHSSPGDLSVAVAVMNFYVSRSLTERQDGLTWTANPSRLPFGSTPIIHQRRGLVKLWQKPTKCGLIEEAADGQEADGITDSIRLLLGAVLLHGPISSFDKNGFPVHNMVIVGPAQQLECPLGLQHT